MPLFAASKLAVEGFPVFPHLSCPARTKYVLVTQNMPQIVIFKKYFRHTNTNFKKVLLLLYLHLEEQSSVPHFPCPHSYRCLPEFPWKPILQLGFRVPLHRRVSFWDKPIPREDGWCREAASSPSVLLAWWSHRNSLIFGTGSVVSLSSGFGRC